MIALLGANKKSANALEVKILIFHWKNVYFLDTEEGLLVAWGRKALVFHKEIWILIFHWENVYFLDTEQGLLVAWGRKILVFHKENIDF